MQNRGMGSEWKKDYTYANRKVWVDKNGCCGLKVNILDYGEVRRQICEYRWKC